MKTKIPRIRNHNLILAITAIALSGGCSQCSRSQMSEYIPDKTAGMNGSFEVTKSGLPVNWLVYTPKTIPTGDYDLIIDTVEFKDGKQSLKFLVRECSANGGWHSPGFCNQYKADPGDTYKVSCWIKNVESEFIIRIGGISATKGQYDTIFRSKETINSWQFLNYTYSIPEKMDFIRFEMNIIQPGTFWIDDVKIEKNTK